MLLRTGHRKCSFACRTAKDVISKSRFQQYAVAAPLTEPLEDFQSRPHGPKGVESIQVSTLENGIKVASMEMYGPLSKLNIFLQAGTRFETPGNYGISHLLRNAAFLSSKERSALHIVRETEGLGASLEVTTNREHFIYSATSMRDKMPTVLANVSASILGPLFYPWELEEARRLTALDNAVMRSTLQAGAMDSLHKAAYRTGLGNSLYCEQDRVGAFTSEDLNEFTSANFVAEKMCVIGVGVSHHELLEAVSRAFATLPRGAPAVVTPTKYYGGEIRQRTGGQVLHVALAAEGAGVTHKDFATLGVLQRVLGVTPFIKWGSHTVSSRINRAVLEATNSGFMASAVNVGYSDSGLFGFYAITEPKHARQVLKAVVAEVGSVAKGNLSDEELVRAKNQLKASVLMSSESQDAVVEDIAGQLFLKGLYTSPAENIKGIDKITAQDVSNMAKKLFSGKSTMACIGETSQPPYLDDLF